MDSLIGTILAIFNIKFILTFIIETTLDCLDEIKSTKKVYEVLGNSTKNSNITSKIKRNDMIHFKNGGSCMTTKVLEVTRYMTFEDALKKVNHMKIYPNIVDEKEAINYFDSIFSITKQKSQNGIFMIKFEISY